MAEFGEVMGNIKKMCKRYSRCEDCPLSLKNNGTNLWSCDAFVKEYPKETEEIVMKWLKEHPIKTNADKFKEVFGFEPNKAKCPFMDSVEECSKYNLCVNCTLKNFWKEEYKESEEEE